MVIHLWRGIAPRQRCLAARVRPIPETGPGVFPATGQATRRLCLALHRMGFIMPRRSLPGRWALTPPFHPDPDACPSASWRYILCDTFHRRGLSPPSSADFSAACCLVVFGLSSPAEAGATICPAPNLRPKGRKDKGKRALRKLTSAIYIGTVRKGCIMAQWPNPPSTVWSSTGTVP